MEKAPLLGKEYILCDQWLQLLDQLNIGAFTIDLNRKITAFNRNMQALLETEDIDVVGKDCREVFVGFPCHGKCPFRGSQDPDTEYMDVEIVDKHDAKHLITRMVTPLYSPDSQITGCLTVFQDHSHFAGLISRIHYEERSMKIILDNLDIGIFTVNRGGYVTFFNTAAEKITGYKRNQMLGRLFSVLFGQNGVHDVELLKKSMTDGQVRTGRSCNITTREGVSIPIRADYMPLQNETGEVVGGLATIQDLTLAHQLDRVISERHTFYDMLGKAPAHAGNL